MMITNYMTQWHSDSDIIILPVDLVVDCDLVHVQHQPGDVAHNEDGDNDH